MHRTFAVSFLALTSALYAQAQVPEVPAEVVEVRSFGTWEAAEQSGHYRLVVTRSGFEHVTGEVYLEWIAETEEGPVRVEATSVTEVNEAGTFAVGIEVVERDEVTVRLTNAYTQESSLLRICPGSPGVYVAKAV